MQKPPIAQDQQPCENRPEEDTKLQPNASQYALYIRHLPIVY